jgi:hypothetical protein
MPTFLNLDAAETIMFQRELEKIKAQSYDVVYADLKAMQLIPVSTDAGAGTETITYQQYDRTGFAKIISNYADDLPRVDVKGKEFTSRVRSVGDSFGYSLQEIRAATKAGKPLEQRKANAAVEAMRYLWNKIAFYGDAVFNLQGWLSNTNIPHGTAPADGTSSATTLASKTPDKVVRDLNTCANNVAVQTKGVEKANTLVMPLAQYTYIASTRMGDGSDVTILDFFLKNNPFIKSVEWSEELDSAQLSANGISTFTGDIMIAYNKSPDKMTLEIPVPFEQLPVQEKGLEYVVNCHSRIGGVLIYYPLSQYIMDGI